MTGGDMKRFTRRCATLAAGFTLSVLASVAFAQSATFPERGRPITLIVPYAPGGVTDTGARLMAAGLEKELGTTVVVLNKAGAASQVGLQELVRSKPDGYTLSYAVLPTVITHYAVPGRDVTYTRASFQPVAMHHYVPQTISVRADGPYKTLGDLIEAARKNPEKISVSDSGLMAVPHTQVLMLERAAGVRFTSIHYTGGAPSITALMGGHVDALAGATADALPNKQNGTFRVLAIAADQPDKSMPDVPTMKSLGYDVMAASWTGILAPTGTPANVVDTLTKAMQKVIESPEHQKKLEELALSPAYMDPVAYAKLWADTETRIRPILENLQTK
jgi:tripartite-type tricarboxylate transporter receptor subunit TctC